MCSSHRSSCTASELSEVIVNMPPKKRSAPKDAANEPPKKSQRSSNAKGKENQIPIVGPGEHDHGHGIEHENEHEHEHEDEDDDDPEPEHYHEHDRGNTPEGVS